ncbi:putative bifunctional diguanylate cyclase/phosphodiesterase [Marinobacterium rhizophilum]|uniref:EAL domain-containing protein n=1 Tax=Marinobacterium rhizophilum TaxID=420402 RepID=A0ABY5HI68_9GAMM|nr:EAL domain-containing protein [Marinobacterium rhizophilum]UTW10671.1 EAL domain-containing protein [Marinobacterium rhizophilum]
MVALLRRSIATRYGAILVLITFGVSTALLVFSLYVLQGVYSRINVAGQDAIETSIVRQVSRDALLLGETLANSLVGPVYRRDFSEIQDILAQLKQRTEIGYIYIYDDKRRILHDGSAELRAYDELLNGQVPAGLGNHFRPGARPLGEYLHVVHPIVSGKTTLAAVRFSMSYRAAQADIDSMSDQLANTLVGLRQEVKLVLLLGFVVLVLLTLALSVAVSRCLTRPLQELAARSRRFRAHDDSASFSLERDDEVGELAEALEQMRLRVQSSHGEVSRLAYHDPLTGLANRRLLQQELEQMLLGAQGSGESLAMMFIDLDHFKQVNDGAGHDVGDQVLKVVAARLEKLVVDAALDGLVGSIKPLIARLGGDEFTLVFPLTDAACTDSLARRVSEVFVEPVSLAGQRFSVSASIGITLYPEDGGTAQDMMRHADIAMYAAKHAGRHQYCFFRQDMKDQLQDHLMVLQGIDQAIAESQLFLEYQPIIDLQTNQVSGGEALVRWNHPQHGLIPPGRFIPIVEDSDRIEALTLWVMRCSCRALRQQILPQAPDFKLSLNVSGVALQSDRLRDGILEILLREKVPPQNLRIEITETTMMRNVEKCAETLRHWQHAGLRVLIDDFGTGYSSLSYLTTLPIDGLKIDRSFINKQLPGSYCPVVEAILALSKSLGIQSIAEGVETEYQLQSLREMKATHAQGYLLGRPMALEKLLERLGEIEVG